MQIWKDKKQETLLSSSSGKPKHNVPHHGSPAARQQRARMAYYAAAAIVIIIIIAAAYLALSSASNGGAYALDTNRTIAMAPNQTVLLSQSSSAEPAAVEMSNFSGTTYDFLLTEAPVLANPIYSFSLSPGQVINVSATGSATADMQIKLVSAGADGAEVEFIPIPASFGIRSSILQTVSSGGTTQAATTTAPATTSAPVTTAGTQSTATTTAAATTTSSSGAYTTQQVMEAANLTEYGILMNDFKALYAKDTGCTQGTYDALYFAQYGVNATGGSSYQSVSLLTPYEMVSSVSKISGSDYYVNYSTASHSSATTGTALSLQLDVQSGQVIAATFSGIYAGLTYAELNSTYAAQAAYGTDCAAYLS